MKKRQSISRQLPQEHIPLPADLVGWRVCARLHQIALYEVQRAIRSGQLPLIFGAWRDGRVLVRQVLDEDGQRIFHQIWYAQVIQQEAVCPLCPQFQQRGVDLRLLRIVP
jgi:hypothetical protein